MLACSRAFVGRARAVRRLGSAALDLCYVAAGRFDGFWEERLKPWDIAAGALIVEEAGGLVTGMDGAPFDAARATSSPRNAALQPQTARRHPAAIARRSSGYAPDRRRAPPSCLGISQSCGTDRRGAAAARPRSAC